MQFPGSLADLQSLIEVMPNPIIVKNRAHRIVLLNRLACEFLGHPQNFLLTHSDSELFPAHQVRGFHEADDRVFTSGCIDEREERVTNGLGIVCHVITRKQVILLNGFEYIVAVISDVTAYRESEARSKYLTYYDTLSGLPNNVLFMEHLNQAFAKVPNQCALLLIDLDHFRTINDRYGFPVGDELIIQFSQRLLALVQSGNSVARSGGDAFSILLTDIDAGAAISNVEDICQRVLIAASEEFELTGAHVQLSTSIGVVVPQHEPIIPSEMLRRADLALHQAKADGRRRWCIHTDELDRKFKHRQSTEADLREAIATGTGIEVYYQPLAAISSGSIIGFEALVRWRHSTRGMVMPNDFISVAEATGLIVKLGEMVLKEACREAVSWDLPLRLSVNVSPIQFVQGDLVSTIEEVLKESGLDPHRLELEITENVLIDDANGTTAILKRIRAIGVGIVLDDFGTGFSSLGYLRHFPFDKVKIDKSFITDMMDNAQAIAIVKAVLLLSKSLNIEVVAEGVETVDQFRLLSELGCTQVQGYLIGRPMPNCNFVGSAFFSNVQIKTSSENISIVE